MRRPGARHPARRCIAKAMLRYERPLPCNALRSRAMIDVGMSVVVVPPLRERRASTHSIGIVRPRYLANDLMKPNRDAKTVSRVGVHSFAGCKPLLFTHIFLM